MAVLGFGDIRSRVEGQPIPICGDVGGKVSVRGQAAHYALNQVMQFSLIQVVTQFAEHDQFEVFFGPVRRNAALLNLRMRAMTQTLSRQFNRFGRRAKRNEAVFEPTFVPAFSSATHHEQSAARRARAVYGL